MVGLVFLGFLVVMSSSRGNKSNSCRYHATPDWHLTRFNVEIIEIKVENFSPSYLDY